MLVDLARNDVNRVCQPKTVKVDHLMKVEKFSHVIHLTSQVSGTLRDGLTRLVEIVGVFSNTEAYVDLMRFGPYFLPALYQVPQRSRQ